MPIIWIIVWVLIFLFIIWIIFIVTVANVTILSVIISIIGLIIFIWIVLLIIAAFLPRESRITAEQIISVPINKVRNYVKLIKNQENYSVRVMADPNVKMTYTWEDGKVWFKSARESDIQNVWKWEQEITKIEEWKSYEVEIRFEQPFKGTNYANTSLESVSETQTKITNTFWWTTKRPMNLMSMLMEKTLKKQIQQNLENLKAILEK